MRLIHPLLTGLLIAAPLAAQTAADSAVLKATQRVQAILGIPKRADEARRAGVPDTTIRAVIDILSKNKIPAQEAESILVMETHAATDHGPTDNFGAFVQSQLAAGKRGRELAAAIHAEHERRGKGGPKHAHDADEHARGGRPEGAGQSKRPDAPPAGKKPAADSANGKRPGNPNAKHP